MSRIRHPFYAVAVLACSSVYATTPTATIDQSASYFKIDMTRPPPQPAPVYVVNLPLDDDGAVRVTSAPARQPILVEAIPGGVTIESGTHYYSPSVSTSGYSWVGLLAKGNWEGPTIQWRWDGSAVDEFGAVEDLRNGSVGVCTSLNLGGRKVCAVSGVEVRFHLYNAAVVPVRLDSIQVYLIP